MLAPIKPAKLTFIVNGTRAGQNQFPWTALLTRRDENTVACSGVLVAPTWILTAGHCLHFLIAAPYPMIEHDLAYVGGTNLGDQDDPQLDDLGVMRVIKATYFFNELDIENYDIGLLELNQPVPGIQPIPLDTNLINAQPVPAIIVGYGTDENDNKDTLRFAGVKIVQQSTCAGKPVTERMLCTQDTSSVVCSGDSGGPLLVTTGGVTRLAGIANTIDEDTGCGINAEGEREAAFAKVSSYAGWIETTTNVLQ